MSTTAMSAAAQVAAGAAAAVEALTDDQVRTVLEAAQHRELRELQTCWEAVTAADPALAAALDDLHATGTERDLPRFEALAAAHEKGLRKALRGPAGKFSAAAILVAIAVAVFAASGAIAHLIGLPVFIATASGAAALCIASTVTANRIAAGVPTRVFADADYAVSTVWDAAIDAAAARAVRRRSGTDGLTPDVLAALGATWSAAGLEAPVPAAAAEHPALRAA